MVKVNSLKERHSKFLDGVLVEEEDVDGTDVSDGPAPDADAPEPSTVEPSDPARNADMVQTGPTEPLSPGALSLEEPKAN